MRKSLADASSSEEGTVPSNLVPTVDALQNMLQAAVDVASRAREAPVPPTVLGIEPSDNPMDPDEEDVQFILCKTLTWQK